MRIPLHIQVLKLESVGVMVVGGLVINFSMVFNLGETGGTY
jgi:hypothetical protein